MTSSNAQEPQTLEQIEDDYSGDPPPDVSRLVATAHALRRKPIGALDAEDRRLLLLQQEVVQALTPLALTQLEADPLAEGDFFPGDLFEPVLKNRRSYWTQHPDQRARPQHVIEAIETLGNLEERDAPQGAISKTIRKFQDKGK